MVLIYGPSVEGSSPRMRGAPSQKVDELVDLRIIPADAGSTKAAAAVDAPNTDHPRGCGEHTALRLTSMAS